MIPMEWLTPGERAVYERRAAGRRNLEIAAELGITAIATDPEGPGGVSWRQLRVWYLTVSIIEHLNNGGTQWRS